MPVCCDETKRIIRTLQSPAYGDTFAQILLDALRYALEDASHRENHGNDQEQRQFQAECASRFNDALNAITAPPHNPKRTAAKARKAYTATP